MNHWLMMLAQDPNSATPPPGGGALADLLIPLILVVVVFYAIMYWGGKKERRKYQDMLSNLKRNDRVQTVGGVLGTVVEVRDNEVVLKVDETSNVKMRFTRNAIKEVLADAGAAAEKK